MFNYTSACKTKVITDFLRKSDPGGCQKVRKEDRRSPRGIQKEPQRASKTEDATNEIQSWSPKWALGPQRRPRGQPGLKRRSWECPRDSPGGVSAGAPGAVLYWKNEGFCMISASESNRKAKEFLKHFIENVQKQLLFQCKTASDAFRRGGPEA